MFHKIENVKALDNYILLVDFRDGTTKTYDMKPLISEIDAFSAFIDTPSLFNQVKVGAGGFDIYWNDYLDFPCDELWENGTLYTSESERI